MQFGLHSREAWCGESSTLARSTVHGQGSPSDGASSFQSGADSTVTEAQALIRDREWAMAQRVLEGSVRHGLSSEGRQYLSEVQAVRRCMRQLNKWPRDAMLHLQLGWLYFRLELGDEALAAFSDAAKLDPDLAEAYYGLALEHLFRDEVAAARRAEARAHDLDPLLPSFAELQHTFERADGQERGRIA